MAFHSLSELSSNHAIHFKEYANEAARLADTGLTSNDVKKIVLQTDDNSYWSLVDVTPTWIAVGGDSSPLTTKGDMFTYDTDNQRLAIGADGKVLKSLASEATGLVWGDLTTSDVAEGTNEYYTEAKADARVTVGINALIDGAPATLDTLNEIAASIADDADFASTVSAHTGGTGADHTYIDQSVTTTASPSFSDVEIDAAEAFYLGDKTTDGSWRIIRNGTNLEMQRRESSVWVQKTIITS